VTRDSHSPSRPSEVKHHVLSAERGGGIRKSKNTKMTRQQRVRAEKAMDRAADDMDKWELKKARSIEKAASIKERAKLWEDVNEESEKVLKQKSAFAVLAEEAEEKKKKKKSVKAGDEVVGDVVMDVEEVPGKVDETPAEATSVAAPVVEDELL
jgi:hypothetical protein